MTGGWNPVTGRDPTGSRPPFAPFGAPVPSQDQPYIYHTGGPSYNYGGPWASGGQGLTGSAWMPKTFSYQANERFPQSWPVIEPNMPAAQMTNTYGGVGCEPGYNYFFPAEHTKVLVLKSSTPPWQLPATAQLIYKAVYIPCNTSFAELLRGFGCTNPNPKKNRVFEVVSGGGGKWYKGLEVGGGDEQAMAKTIGQVGWDSTRTGLPGEKPVVFVWFCKD